MEWGIPVSKFTRPLTERWVAGVCAGLAEQLGMDVAVFRIIALFTAPVSIWIYILLWVFTTSSSNRSF
jgi:phage shock protein PspC (stress-responsive transcriptional regulator)